MAYIGAPGVASKVATEPHAQEPPMPATPLSVPASDDEQLAEQANHEAAVRLAELDDEEDPRPGQPPLKDGVHTLDLGNP